MHSHPPEGDALALPAGHIVNHYRIVRVIGRGGFGITYAAEDIHTSTEIAIKELLPSSIATRAANYNVVAQSSSLQKDFQWSIRSFILEAQTLTKFHHPHLVRMLEYFEQNGTAYMVMPYIKGNDLKTRVQKNGPLPVAQALPLLHSLMSALACIHQAGILHRDVKPENIILREPDNQPILLDFGASRNLVSTQSQAMTSIISPGYAPIEQYSTDAQYQGPWSDIYALASSLYFALSGIAPPEAPDRSNAIRHGRPDPCTPLHLIRRCKVSQPVSYAIMHGMQLSERDRPQTIQAWQASFLQTPPAQAPATVQQPSQPRPQPSARPLYPPRKAQGKKNKPVAILATIAILIFSLLTLGGFLGYEHFQKKKSTPGTIGSSNRPSPGSPDVATVHGGSPSGGTGTTPVQAKPDLTTDQVRRFVLDYYHAGESGRQLDYYADYVDYFGTPSCSLDDINRNNLEYCDRWPNRSYTPDPKIDVKPYSNDRFHTSTRLRYAVNNSVEFQQGMVRSVVVVRPVNGHPKIIEVSNSIIEPATITYDAREQEKSAKQFITRFIGAGNSSQGSILNQLDYYASSVSPYYRVDSANQSYIRNDLLRYADKFPSREYRIIGALGTKGAGSKTITVFAKVSYTTRNTSASIRRGDVFNTYQLTYQAGQAKITSVTSEPIK